MIGLGEPKSPEAAARFGLRLVCLTVFPTLALLPRLGEDKQLGEEEARHLGGVPICSVS
jgi:hypothetical protein